MMRVNFLSPGKHHLSALVALLSLAALIENSLSPTVSLARGTYARGPVPVLVTVLIGVSLLVALRALLGPRAAPAALLLLGVSVFSAPAWVLNSPVIFLLVMLLCGLGGYSARTATDQAGVVVLWLVGSLAAWQDPEAGLGALILTSTYMTVAWSMGHAICRPVLRAASAEQRAADLELRNVAAARQAVVVERERIARELHDIIAHSTSVMTLQAGAVRRRLAAEQRTERDSLEAVERTGREALAELRRLVGLWRDDDEPAHYEPQPSLERLGALLDGVRAAGLPVEAKVVGTPHELAPAVGLTAYRVVQEALTNVLKHAGPATATVGIEWRSDELELHIVDDGRLVSSGVGFGHLGMRERLRLYGGELDSGPLPGGGYSVRARLPFSDLS